MPESKMKLYYKKQMGWINERESGEREYIDQKEHHDTT
jgi:hypothetical protein